MPTATAKEVADAAAKAGIKVSEGYVRTIRYNAKTKKPKTRGRKDTPRSSRPKNGKMTATAFVLGMPGVAAKDVVAAAKKAGIKLSDRYVYVIRSSANAKARRIGKGVGPGHAGRGGGAEAALRQAIAELGLGRARQVLAEVESAFR